MFFSVVPKVVTMMVLLVWFSPVFAQKNTAYSEIEWVALIPQDDLKVLLNPPRFLDITDGSEQDSLDALGDDWLADENVKRFKQAMQSTNVIRTYENKKIRIPGFVVPLISNEARKVTEFFAVPYFGACLHMPPPPPNQIIYAASKNGIEVEDLYEPFWFEGTLTIETNKNALGTSAYRLTLDRVLPYEDE